MPTYTETGLWRRSFDADRDDNVSLTNAKERLRSSYESFRQKVALLSADINRELPDYTVHDISHIDALWEVADVIAGPNYPLNPIETWVLGGAFLLHDLGMGLAAWPGRERGLEAHPRWRDTVESIRRRTATTSIPEPRDVRSQAIRELLRLLHAEHAERLSECAWPDDVTGCHHYLIEDEALRFHLGPLVGRLAHSHWWNLREVHQAFSTIKGAPTGFPALWTLDALRIAALLRAADAAHLDDRRAPRLLRAAREINGFARSHWIFQGHFLQLRNQHDRIVFSATRPFSPSEANAWWLAFDTLRMVDAELAGVDALLADAQRNRFLARSVAGAGDPHRLVEYLPVSGWEPIDAKVRVGDVLNLVERLGGSELYGEDLSVPLRELIQNAVDAIQARRILEGRDKSWGFIVVRTGSDSDGPWIEVEDNGVGMSRTTLAGPLLDFGASYWDSPLCHEEHSGLLSKGFSPIGKFGIGFFSVFMWGRRVCVTSRRYDRGLHETMSLEFSDGPANRPLLRPATNSVPLRDGGTRVRVYLRFSPLRTSRPRTPDHLQDALLHGGEMLKRLCAWLAPALAVDLFVEIDGVQNSAVGANDWMTISPSALLCRLDGIFDEHRSYLSGIPDDDTGVGEDDDDDSSLLIGRSEDPNITRTLASTNLRPIYDSDGSCIARASILPPAEHGIWRKVPNYSAITVGGLRATNCDNLAGLFTGQTRRADRMSAEPFANGGPLAYWATEQGILLTKALPSSGQIAEAAGIVYQCDGSFEGMHIAIHRDHWMTPQDIAATFAGANQLMIWGDSAYHLSRRNAELVLLESVLVVSLGMRPLIDHSPSQRGRRQWPPKDSDEFHRRSLVGAIVRTMARAWNVDEEELWKSTELTTDQHKIKRQIGHRNGKPYVQSVDIINRLRT